MHLSCLLRQVSIVGVGIGTRTRRTRPGRWCLAGALCLLSPATAAAHPGATAELQQLDARVHDDPKNVTLRVRYADAATRAGHLHEARAQANAIDRLDPEEREVHRIRAEIWLARDRPRAAERELTEYLSDGVTNAGSGRAYAARARLRHKAGLLDLARADYDSAIPLSPTPELILERGQLDDARDELGDLVAGYQQGLELLGPAVTVQLALIDAQRRDGHPRLALEQVDELLSLSPTRPDWILIRADLLDRLDQPVAGLIHRVVALYFAHRNLQRRPTQSNRLMLARAESALAHRNSP